MRKNIREVPDMASLWKKIRKMLRRGSISVEKIVGVVISFVVIMIVLAALLPTFMNATNTLSGTVANETSLAPVKPLIDNLPLLFILGVVIGLIFGVLKIYKESG